MKKLLFFLLLVPCLLHGQQTYFTPGVPTSSTSFSPTFRFNGTDSLASFYLNNSNRWSQFYTAAQANKRFALLSNPLTNGYGFLNLPYNGSVSVALKIDTSLIQTIGNFFPKGDTRYIRDKDSSLTYVTPYYLTHTAINYIATPNFQNGFTINALGSTPGNITFGNYEVTGIGQLQVNSVIQADVADNAHTVIGQLYSSYNPSDFSSEYGGISFGPYSELYSYQNTSRQQNIALISGNDMVFMPGTIERLRLHNNGLLEGAASYSAYYDANSYIQKGYADATYAGSGSGVTSFNTRTGAITLSSADVTTALGYTPLSTISGITAGGDLAGTYPNPTVNTINSVTKSYYDPTSSIQTQLNGKQATLVSGTNIKTINSTTLIGSGNLAITTANTDTTSTGFATQETLLPYLTKAQIVSGYQPLENQRLSTTNNVQFVNLNLTGNLSIAASKIVSIGGYNVFGQSGTTTYEYTGPSGLQFVNTANTANIALLDNSGNFSATSFAGPLTGNVTGNATNITATSNSTLTTLSALSLPYSQITGTPSLTGYFTLSTPNQMVTQIPTFSSGVIYGNNTTSPTFSGSSGTAIFSLNNRFSYQNLSTGYVRSEYSNYVGTSTIKFPNLATTTLEDSTHAKTTYASGGSISWPGTIYSTPTTGTVSAGVLTFAPALATQTANTFLAGPSSGSAATPAFRAIVAGDIPTLNQNTTGQAGSVANAWTPGSTLTNTSGAATYNGSAAGTYDVNQGYAFNFTNNISIAGASTGYALSVSQNIAGSGIISYENTNNSGYSSVDLKDNTGTKQMAFGYANTGVSNANLDGLDYFYSSNGANFSFQGSSGEWLRINSTGLGIATSAPTTSLTFGSTSTGTTSFNTTDQTTNYQKFRSFWNSGAYTLITQAGGSSTVPDLVINSNGSQTTYSNVGINGYKIQTAFGSTVGTGTGGIIQNIGTLTATSGAQVFYGLLATINQSASTAANTIFKINTVNTSVGSGAFLLTDMQYGSSSKWKADNNGNVTQSGSLAINQSPTVINCSTSGTANFNETEQGSAFKMVVVTLSAALGTASYTYATSFTNTPVILTTSGLSSSLVTTNGTSSITITGATSTGTLILMGN